MYTDRDLLHIHIHTVHAYTYTYIHPHNVIYIHTHMYGCSDTAVLPHCPNTYWYQMPVCLVWPPRLTGTPLACGTSPQQEGYSDGSTDHQVSE